MNDNVVLHPAAAASAQSADERRSIEQLIQFCERANEGLQHVTAALVSLNARIRRLELAQARAEKQKLQATAIYNPQGERVR